MTEPCRLKYSSKKYCYGKRITINNIIVLHKLYVCYQFLFKKIKYFLNNNVIFLNKSTILNNSDIE